jgi:hypothetical protein
MAYINHYRLGGGIVSHKGKNIFISDNATLTDYLKTLESMKVDAVIIPAGYEHRPDLISDLFYGTVTKDWLIMMFNNIKDPFQELNVGDKLLLPKL